jgi:hypothetical protein
MPLSCQLKTVVLNLINNRVNSLRRYNTAQIVHNYTQNGSAFVPTQPKNFEPSPYSKARPKNTMVQNFVVPCRLIQFSHPPQKFENPTIVIVCLNRSVVPAH